MDDDLSPVAGWHRPDLAKVTGDREHRVGLFGHDDPSRGGALTGAVADDGRGAGGRAAHAPEHRECVGEPAAADGRLQVGKPGITGSEFGGNGDAGAGDQLPPDGQRGISQLGRTRRWGGHGIPRGVVSSSTSAAG